MMSGDVAAVWTVNMSVSSMAVTASNKFEGNNARIPCYYSFGYSSVIEGAFYSDDVDEDEEDDDKCLLKWALVN